MEIVRIGGIEISARIRKRIADTRWNGRESVELTMELTNQDAAALFANDVPWSLVKSYADMTGEGTTEIDMSEYSVAGDIIDHRNGTVTVKMGKTTVEEVLAILTGE